MRESILCVLSVRPRVPGTWRHDTLDCEWQRPIWRRGWPSPRDAEHESFLGHEPEGEKPGSPDWRRCGRTTDVNLAAGDPVDVAAQILDDFPDDSYRTV